MTGLRRDKEVWYKKCSIRLFISGDIIAEDIKSFLDKTSPYGFEAGASVERLPKGKDCDKMSAFIKAARGPRV
ncbi:MAG: hypothetical protein LBS61_06425 [Endomicrobium sp.]|jgi:phosphoribosylanthranilate isomerase|nr:hypothetical protein [Endomicrobium sp.]